jgi:hypothetical protein
MPASHRPHVLAFAAFAAFAALPGLAPGQAKVEVNDVAIQAQQTPQFNVTGVKDKRWKPKAWMELEVAFEADLPRAEVIDALVFRYYIVLEGPREKQKTLVGDVTHVNVPVGEAAYAVVYLSPATIKAITGSEDFDAAGVRAWGVEVLHGGELVGGKSSTNNKWWDGGQATPPRAEGLILNKKQTPFAPLWGDYHVDVQSAGS